MTTENKTVHIANLHSDDSYTVEINTESTDIPMLNYTIKEYLDKRIEEIKNQIDTMPSDVDNSGPIVVLGEFQLIRSSITFDGLTRFKK